MNDMQTKDAIIQDINRLLGKMSVVFLLRVWRIANGLAK